MKFPAKSTAATVVTRQQPLPGLRTLAALLVLTLTLASTSCSLFGRKDSQARSDNANLVLEQAQADIDAGELDRALDSLISVREVQGLLPEVRLRDEELLEQCAELLLEQYQAPEYDSGDFKSLYNLDLPPRLKARAGILAADRMLEEGRRIKAYRMVKKVDKKIPTHPERGLAGDVMARAGLSLIRDDRRYYLFFNYRERGIDAMEYLTLQYPSDPRCAEAYAELARVYEDQNKLTGAIERLERLLIYHPESPYGVAGEARLPYLRLERLRRDDYDRRELEFAYQDVQRWLRRHPGNELEPWVRELGAACEARLTANDLILARYYRTWGSTFGTRLHAERALRTAESAQLEKDAAEARAILAKLPARATAVEILPRDESSFLDTQENAAHVEEGVEEGVEEPGENP